MFEWLVHAGANVAILYQILTLVFSVPITIAIGLIGSLVSIGTLFLWLHGVL
jgi:xanthosine utilization system XapX-like protein